MHRIIPVINAVILSAFTIASIRDSFSLFVMFSVVFAAIGLIFMRRKTANDVFYVRASLITAGLCLLVYGMLGIYLSGQQGSGLNLFTFIIFTPVVIPAYLSMGYALAAIIRR